MGERYVLEASGISKRYGGIQALSDVHFQLRRGEVHALMGENGAGKSTLAKIMAGIEAKDAGTLYVDGKEVVFTSVRDAMEAGISIVLQEFNLIPHLTVAENIFLSHPDTFRWDFFIHTNRIVEKTSKLLRLFHMEAHIHPLMVVKDLSVAEMQIIEILKAVANESDIIILDEPTAALSQQEVEKLFDVIRQLKEEGVSFVIVSHRFNEIYATSDRITVFRDGKLVLLGEPIAEVSQQQLIERMVGRNIEHLYGERKEKLYIDEAPILQVVSITNSTAYVKDVSLQVRRGEIVGIAGLVGSGRTEVVNSIFGADKPTAGHVYVDGMPLTLGEPKEAIKSGIALVPEDRKHDGLLLPMSVKMNLVMADLSIQPIFFLKEEEEKRVAHTLIERLGIKVGDTDLPVESLSGGNQQKVLLAKWLQTSPKVLLVDEPTRGIDILAKSEIYAMLHELAESGMAIVMVSSELPEIIEMCDRVYVMRDGEMVKQLQKEALSEENILQYASFS